MRGVSDIGSVDSGALQDSMNQSMRAFITGAAGFVGSGLARMLIAEGHEVQVLVRPGSDMWRLAPVLDRITVHHGDIRDEVVLTDILRKSKPEALFHLAAYGAYPGTQQDPEKILDTNIRGALAVFQAANHAGVGMVVAAGSSSEYGRKSEAMREDMRLNPSTFYAVGKAAQTHLGQVLSTSETPIITVRLFSVYGPFEEKGRLMPTLISRALSGDDILLAHPISARDFIYLADVVAACLHVATRRDLGGEIVNLGSGIQSTLADACTAVIAATGSGSPVRTHAFPSRSFDTDHWVADTAKLQEVIGFKTRYSLAEGIADMVKWFPSYAHVYTSTP